MRSRRWQLTVAVAGACALAACAAGTPAERTAQPLARRASAPAPRFASPYAYEWFLRAELLRAHGQLSAAIEAYRAALADADEDPYVLARLASALGEAGHPDAADRRVAQALALDPSSEGAWLVRGELCERRGDFAGALAAYEHAEQAAPLSARPPAALSALLQAHGAPERARAVRLRFAARSLPGTRAALDARLRAALATADPERVWQATLPYRTFTRPPRDALNAAARLLFRRGRSAAALRELGLLPADARDPVLWLQVALACGRFAAVETWLVTHAAGNADERREFAAAYIAIGRPDRALSLLAVDRLAHPDDPALSLLAAEALLASGDPAAAAQLYAAIARGSRHYAQAQAGLARALSAGGLPELARECVAAQAPSAERQPPAATDQ